MLLKFIKTHKDAQVPQYATSGSAGLDLVSISEKNVVDGAVAYTEYGTGIAVKIPEGHVGLLFPRSSISSSTTLVLANSVGVIDSDYRGEIKLRFKNIMFGAGKKYKVGEKVGQLVIMPYNRIVLDPVDSLDETERGDGGFGSTNK
jgi:dUTP pyrophosphatase